MHSLLDEYFNDNNHWRNWNVSLTEHINTIISTFLAKLVGQEAIQCYTLLVLQISVSMGGLELLYPSHQAAPDFPITMMVSMR